MEWNPSTPLIRTCVRMIPQDNFCPKHLFAAEIKAPHFWCLAQSNYSEGIYKNANRASAYTLIYPSVPMVARLATVYIIQKTEIIWDEGVTWNAAWLSVVTLGTLVYITKQLF